jgi:tRNA pseudouridine55 synthase
VTSTDDAEGEVVAEHPVPTLTQDDIVQSVQPFIGAIQQIPPMYSAIQVDGRRMYDLARKGETIELAPRPVEIDRIEVLAWQPPLVTLDIACGKGTYIRALARDLGAALDCGAHLASLRRTQVGPLLISNAVPLTALLDGSVQLAEHLLPPESAIAEWPRVDLDDATVKRIRNGLSIQLDDHQINNAHLRAHGPDGALLALLRQEVTGWQPFRVFSWS